MNRTPGRVTSARSPRPCAAGRRCAGAVPAAGCGLLLLLAALAGCAPRGAAVWWRHGVLAPGAHAVGVAVESLTDSTRMLGGRPRPVQMVTWYPARAAEDSAMTYADYVRFADAETTRTAPPDSLSAVTLRRRFLVSHGLDAAVVAEWFSAPMLARRDAPPAPGRFPVVLIAQGNGETAADQCVLAEFLASHGFVVATCPSQSRLTGEPSAIGQVAAAALDQADDLALLRGALAARDDANAADVAIVSHSFGARSALYEAMRDSLVRRLVSLDGGIGTATARDLYEGDPAFRPAAVRIPVLHVYETLDEQMKPDWATLRRLSGADVWIAKTDELHHHHFSDLGAACARWPDVARVTGATQRTGDAYAAVLMWTLAFLETPAPIDAVDFAERAKGAALLQPQQLVP